MKKLGYLIHARTVSLAQKKAAPTRKCRGRNAEEPRIQKMVVF